MALTSPTSGSRSVCKVRSWTQTTEFGQASATQGRGLPCNFAICA
jgi:hypothetical protein